MSIIDLTKTQNGILSDAINNLAHYSNPENNPEPLTSNQVIIYGEYENFSTKMWGWENAKSVELGPNQTNLPWPKAGTQKFKFVPASVSNYFNGHVDIHWLTKDDFADGNIKEISATRILNLLTELCDTKRINWVSLFQDIELPVVHWDTEYGLEQTLSFKFKNNVLVGPIFLKIPNDITNG